MASTIIDSLVVLLGLDASNYKKGREQAEKETKETGRQVKNSANEITKSLTEVGKTIAGLFLGFESASGFTKWLGGLNAGEAALGRTAKSIGMSAHELNKWGNAVDLAGGSASDAQAAFASLTDDFVKLQTTGESSTLINVLRLRNISIKDQNGNLRNQGDIFEELADKTAQYGTQYQTSLFKQIGLQQGYIQYLEQTKEKRLEDQAIAEKNNAITESSIEQAQELQKYWRGVNQEISAAGQILLSSVTPTLTDILGVMGGIDGKSEELQTGLRFVGATAVAIKRVFTGAGDAIGGAAAALAAAAHGDFRGAWAILQDQSARSKEADRQADADMSRILNGPQTAASVNQTVIGGSASAAPYVPPAGSKAARFNNPGNILDKNGQERRYATLAEGEAALEADLRYKIKQHNYRTVDALISAYEGNDYKNNDIPAYIADVKKQLGKSNVDESDIPALAAAIGRHESGPSPRLSGVASRGGATAGSTTTVSVENIHINAPNADPAAVAAKVPEAIQRKFTSVQADSGQS